MDALVEERYFEWLYSQVANPDLRNKYRSHWSLAKQLHKKEFVWIVPNDDNRVADGKDLRRYFVDEVGGGYPSQEWFEQGCSMLEMLIALSHRLAFETDDEPRIWFWHLIATLDLEQYNDRDYNEEAERRIDEALERVIWRTYAPDGRGGLFPLRDPKEDQRKVELWYQLSAYLLELL